MITKKNYKIFAEIFKANLDRSGFFDGNIIISFCDYFKEDNKNFNKSKFLEAVYSKEIEEVNFIDCHNCGKGDCPNCKI